MSQQLISRNADLKRLRDDGYEISVCYNYLVIRNVPYVGSGRKIHFGTLVSELTLSGDVTSAPSTHTISFIGEHPCDKDGASLQIVNESKEKVLAGDLVVQFSFSMKPLENGRKRNYKDYYEKITTYAQLLTAPARAIDSNVSANTFAPIQPEQNECIFNYYDTASSRAEIVEVTKKLQLQRVAIIGLGGSGSYILDFVAKTPVRTIHIYDSDLFFSHNAFRSPGAASLEELRSQPKKVDYFKSKYEKMHRGIIAHDYDIDAESIHELENMDFVFISIHGGNEKELIFDKLEEFGISFVDVGMGLYLVEDALALGGTLRATTSTVYQRQHAKDKVAFSEDEVVGNEYSTNIQVADLNAFNALLAVIKWKKIFGFYLDLENEHTSVYTIDGNTIDNSDKP